MKEVAQDPSRYFETVDLVESLVLHAELRGEQFVLVLGFAADAVAAWLGARRTIGFRDMRRLRFGGVADFSFRRKPERDWQTIDAHTPGSNSISELELKRAGSRFRLRVVLTMGGTVEFAFESLHETGRRIRADGRLPDGDWRYIDVESGEEVPFYYPFGDPP